MTKPYEFESQNETYYYFRSQLSGFPTRAFLDPEEARSELKWLDRQWLDLEAFWTARAVLREDRLNRCLRDMLSDLAWDARVGVARLQITSPGSQFETASGELHPWFGAPRRGCLNGLVTSGEKDAWRVVWMDAAAHTDVVFARIEELSSAVTQDLRPGS